MKLNAASKTEMEQLEREIAMLGEFKDNADVINALFETRRENLQLEAEYSHLKQQLDFLTSIKSKLDEKVRRENERLALERQAKNDALIKGLLEELRRPAMQEAILKKCLIDLQKIKLPPASASL